MTSAISGSLKRYQVFTSRCEFQGNRFRFALPLIRLPGTFAKDFANLQRCRKDAGVAAGRRMRGGGDFESWSIAGQVCSCFMTAVMLGIYS
ncbi:MAG: hypothetical protein E5W72_16080 [Mesorhizobium sp.]|uniref:hypothetical protein n=1 Tax=Mesorhizobium sp. TaxID=1871066 RepID=UPI001204D442|nr:hypothetical protein [Mesorhizobium sp.]TIS96748.1 MAG: hypothetical protein E5W87_28855 [Mesorhizobium sp.]TIT49279.1 MAG: hypothetical protein E5W72_16080 [Mesorhizobium sp.]